MGVEDGEIKEIALGKLSDADQNFVREKKAMALLEQAHDLLNSGSPSVAREVFGEMIHIARMIGNMGAHDGQRDVRPEDADVSDRFFRAVIEYIYVAPDLLNNVRALKDSATP